MPSSKGAVCRHVLQNYYRNANSRTFRMSYLDDVVMAVASVPPHTVIKSLFMIESILVECRGGRAGPHQHLTNQCVKSNFMSFQFVCIQYDVKEFDKFPICYVLFMT
jgi:hypothetical protein